MNRHVGHSTVVVFAIVTYGSRAETRFDRSWLGHRIQIHRRLYATMAARVESTASGRQHDLPSATSDRIRAPLMWPAGVGLAHADSFQSRWRSGARTS